MKSYKGYEIMKMVSMGILSISDKVSTLSQDYKNCTIERMKTVWE